MKFWLTGVTCFTCGNGCYKGWDTDECTTFPCDRCGDIRPAWVTEDEFQDLLLERDRRKLDAIIPDKK